MIIIKKSHLIIFCPFTTNQGHWALALRVQFSPMTDFLIRENMRDDSAEILFQSFLQEALVSSSGNASASALRVHPCIVCLLGCSVERCIRRLSLVACVQGLFYGVNQATNPLNVSRLSFCSSFKTKQKTNWNRVECSAFWKKKKIQTHNRLKKTLFDLTMFCPINICFLSSLVCFGSSSFDQARTVLVTLSWSCAFECDCIFLRFSSWFECEWVGLYSDTRITGYM